MDRDIVRFSAFFHDEVFNQTRLIPQVVPAKPSQMHTRKIWGGFEYKTWEANPHLMPLPGGSFHFSAYYK